MQKMYYHRGECGILLFVAKETSVLIPLCVEASLILYHPLQLW